MRKGLLLTTLILALAGCVNFADQPDMPAVVYYVLEDPSPATAETHVAAGAPTLIVLDTTTGGFYATDQIIFSRTPGTRGQYQFARWTERPGKRFADLMRARLDRQGLWHVSTAGGQVRGDMLLDTKLVEFYHDAASNPGAIQLELNAEVVDLKSHTPLGRKTFRQKVPLKTFDAAGAAQASNVAVGQALDELAAWLATLR